MQGVLEEPSPDWGAQAESVGEGPGKGGEDAVPPAEEAAGSARPGWSPCPSLPGGHPADSEGQMFIFTATLRSSRTFLPRENGGWFVCRGRAEPPAGAALGSHGAPRRGGEHGPRPSSAVSSSSNCCACGNVEGASRIPRTPHPAWAVGSPWPFSPSISSRLAFSCLEEMPVAAVTAPDSSPPSVCLSRDLPKVPCHRRLAESSAPLLSGDMNRSAVSLSLTPAIRTPQPLRSAGPQFPSFMKRAISFNRVVLIALNSAVRKQCLSPSAGVKRPVVKPPGAVVPFKQRLPQAQLRRGITGGLSSPLSGG